MITCKECKFWDSKDGLCSTIEDCGVLIEPEGKRAFYYMENAFEDFEAGFYTGPDFGCIYGEAKSE